MKESNKSILDEWEKELNKVLLGIDKDTIETPDGWWETSTGVEFGTKKLEELIPFISSLLQAQREKDIFECIEVIGKLPVPRIPDNKQNQIIRRLGDLLLTN